MKLSLAVTWKYIFPVFLVLTCVLRVNIVAASLLLVLLPQANLQLSISWKTAAALAVVAALATQALDNPLACMAGKFFVDLCYSRLGSFAYRTLGGIVHFADAAAPLPTVEQPQGDLVHVVRTAKATGERLTPLPPLRLAPGGAPSGQPGVVLDADTRFQRFLGFGGSFTESSAELLQQMGPAQQEQILEAYFSEATGLGFKLGRVHMGSCDFSRGNWSCVEEEGDTELRSFSIERYEQSILPMIRRAQAKAGEPLMLMASPWSPPWWMKDTLSMTQGGKLRPEHRAAWARHYVRFAEAFKAAGVPLWSFTVQNEPQAATPWENCLYTHEEERDFVRDFLGPALEASGLGLKLLIWDHNRDDMFARAHAVLSDPEAAKHVWGVAYHWYGDPRHEMWPAREGQLRFDNLRAVHDLNPEIHIVMSESCQEFGPRIGNWEMGERYGEAIIRDLNNHLEAWIDWNLILDSWGGPNHVQNFVSAPVIADAQANRVLFLSPFYYIGHFSRFIRPGARRILAASNRDALEATAFVNPDGTVAAVVLNRGAYNISFWIQSAGKSVQAEAPANSITTYMLSGAPPAA